jgi:hypothetical protein
MISPNDKNRKWGADKIAPSLSGLMMGLTIASFLRGNIVMAVLALILGLMLLLNWLFSEKLYGEPPKGKNG